MKEPMDDDLLPEHTEIDAYLAASRRALAEQLAAGLDLNAGLTAILGTRNRQPDPNEPTAAMNASSSPSARPGTSSSASSTTDHAALVITLRMRAQEIVRDLDPDQGLDPRRRLIYGDGLPARELDCIRDLDLTIVRDLDRHLARYGDLDRTHDLHLVPACDVNLVRVRNIARHLARELARAVVRARSRDNRSLFPGSSHLGDLQNEHKSAVAAAWDIVRNLIIQLDAIDVDASAADLSSLSLSDRNVLEGVMWTDETVWPPGVRDQVRVWSDEIRPGVYRVSRKEGGRDRTGLVIT
jgi:hypothetical protein